MPLQKTGHVLGELELLVEETGALMTSLEEADISDAMKSEYAELQAIRQRAATHQREQTLAMLETLENLPTEDSSALLDCLRDPLSPTALSKTALSPATGQITD